MLESFYIIDDDEISTFLTANMLEGFSKNLKCFSSAKTALQQIMVAEESKVLPFIVFLDLNMPLMDGWEFLEAVNHWRDTLRERCIVVILTSSINEAEIKRSGAYEPVIKFVSKPLDEEGIASIYSLLGQKSAESNKAHKPII